MPQNSPQAKPPVRLRLKLPPPKQIEKKSLFEEYPSVFFVVFFAFVTILAKAGGMSLRDALVLGAWLVSIAYFSWQVIRYRKEKSAPKAVKKTEFAKQMETPKKAEFPRKTDTPKKPVPVTPKPVSELQVSETKPPRWPPPPPRLVAPLSVTLSKKAQQAKKAEPEQNPKQQTDQNPKQ
jgi:hypothetical protein